MRTRQLSEEMVSYLTNFAKTGNPNGSDLARWEPQAEGQAEVMRLGEGASHMGDVSMEKLYETMRNSHATGE